VEFHRAPPLDVRHCGDDEPAGGEMTRAPGRLSIVMPCYNEQQGLADSARQVLQVLSDLVARGRVADGSNLWLVDDGSRDGTWGVIEALAAADPRVVGLKLSRNRGHQNALLAGLMNADGDAVISLDADLQDDISVIDDMVTAWQSGFEIVFGVRRSRDEDSFFKRWTARRYACWGSTWCLTTLNTGCWVAPPSRHCRNSPRPTSSCEGLFRSWASGRRRSSTIARHAWRVRRSTRCDGWWALAWMASRRSARCRCG
jgi:hypothetical protein